MPQPGLLLEERPVETPRRGTIAPVTPNVRRPVVRDLSPTPTQEDALRVALNTPDIALIRARREPERLWSSLRWVERLQEIWDTRDGAARGACC